MDARERRAEEEWISETRMQEDSMRRRPTPLTQTRRRYTGSTAAGQGTIDLIIIEDLECVIQDRLDHPDLPPGVGDVAT